MQGRTARRSKHIQIPRCHLQLRSSLRISVRLLKGRERMGQLTGLRRSRTISNILKARLTQTLVWSIVTYDAESWMLKKHEMESIEAFEMVLPSGTENLVVEHVSNNEVLQETGLSRLLLGKIKCLKLRYFGHIVLHSSLANSIVLGYMPGTRRTGAKEYSGLIT